MKHITETPLYIREWETTSLNKTSNFIEIPIGTELEFVKYGDENQIYSSDPVYANCYYCKTKDFEVKSKFLYTDKNNIWSFYNKK